MKPLDITKPVQTRDGRKVRILCTDAHIQDDFEIVGIVYNNSTNQLDYWKSNGSCYASEESIDDLINAPETFEFKRWVNVYEDEVLYWRSKEAADKAASQGRIACIEVVIKGTVGEGL